MALAAQLEHLWDERHALQDQLRSEPVGSGMGVLASHGRPWHHVTRDSVQGDHLISIDDVLSGCSLLLPAVVMWFLRVHMRETERRQNEVLTLRAGETFVGVIEDDEGYCTFIVHDAADGRDDA